MDTLFDFDIVTFVEKSFIILLNFYKKYYVIVTLEVFYTIGSIFFIISEILKPDLLGPTICLVISLWICATFISIVVFVFGVSNNSKLDYKKEYK